MSGEILNLFWTFVIFSSLIFIIGLYCLLATYNLIRALIGVELLIKAVTLLIILVGYVTNRVALAQTLVITLIVIEVVIMVVAMGIVLGLYRKYKNLDLRNLRNLKG